MYVLLGALISIIIIYHVEVSQRCSDRGMAFDMHENVTPALMWQPGMIEFQYCRLVVVLQYPKQHVEAVTQRHSSNQSERNQSSNNVTINYGKTDLHNSYFVLVSLTFCLWFRF